MLKGALACNPQLIMLCSCLLQRGTKKNEPLVSDNDGIKVDVKQNTKFNLILFEG